MAISFGAAAGNNSNSGANTLSTASITVSGTDTYGFAFGHSDSGDNMTGATWNGVAMTLIRKKGAGAFFIYLFGIASPTTGVVTMNRSSTTGRIQVVGSYYRGVNQTGQPDAQTDNSATGSSGITTSLSSIADNDWFVLVTYADSGGLAASTGSTSRSIQGSAGGLFDSNAAKTPAGSYSMSLTSGAGSNTATIMAAFKPFAVPAAVSSPDMRLAFL